MEIKRIEGEESIQLVKPPKQSTRDGERMELQHSLLRTKTLIRFNYNFVSCRPILFFRVFPKRFIFSFLFLATAPTLIYP